LARKTQKKLHFGLALYHQITGTHKCPIHRTNYSLSETDTQQMKMAEIYVHLLRKIIYCTTRISNHNAHAPTTSASVLKKLLYIRYISTCLHFAMHTFSSTTIAQKRSRTST